MNDNPTLHLHCTEVYDSHTAQIPCSQCNWGHPPQNPVTVQQLEGLLDAKNMAEAAWSKARIFATDINGVENLAERCRRDVLEHEAFLVKYNAERTYLLAIEAFVAQKKKG